MRSNAIAVIAIGFALMLAACGDGGGGGGGGGTPGGPIFGVQITQKEYIKSSNSEAIDNFGWVVALDGDTLAVSALGEDSIANVVDGDQINNGGSNLGAVYVFTRSNGVWTQQAYIKPSNPDNGDQFGAGLALSGDTLVVGAPMEDSGAANNPADNNAGDSGAVYVFVRDGTTWTQQANLKASDIGTGDLFGFSVAIDGDTLAVGAQREDSNATGVNGDQLNENGGESGAAYVFVRSSGNWTQEAYVKPLNTGISDFFGSSVALSGDTLAVGAPLEDLNATGVNPIGGADTAGESGAAYVFIRSGALWNQQAYIKASNTGADDEFGWSVALDGDTLAVGARFEGSAANGAAYVFTRTGTFWSQQALIRASNAEDSDAFGSSIALDGDLLAAGAPAEASEATSVGGTQTNNSAPNSGAAYLFQRAGGAWSQRSYIKASNSDMSDKFGGAVALSGTTVVVGAVGEDSFDTGVGADQVDFHPDHDSGAAYVFAP